MRFLSKSATILLALLGSISACSLYQSEGRKFLEKEAFEYSGAQAYLSSCPGYDVAVADLTLVERTSTAQIFQLPTESNVRIVTNSENPYACDYGFATPQERDAILNSAIELTLRLGEFANRQIYPLK